MSHQIRQIIYLNGPSSSGKTTLAQALQHTLNPPFLRLGIDTIISWTPDKMHDWTGRTSELGYSWKKGVDHSGAMIQELQAGPYAKKIEKTLKEVVLTLARMGHHIIIDDVSYVKEERDQWKEILADFDVLWVGVTCPLSVLEERERSRQDRIFGSARGQFHKVHEDAEYDLMIDTYATSLADAVHLIQEAATTQTKQRAATHDVSRLGVYGIAQEKEQILVIRQPRGPFFNRYDLPGGKIEFGETIEEALHREFVEEVGMDFVEMRPIKNASRLLHLPGPNEFSHKRFHHVGLLYFVSGLHPIRGKKGCLEHSWEHISRFTEDNSAPFLLQALSAVSIDAEKPGSIEPG